MIFRLSFPRNKISKITIESTLVIFQIPSCELGKLILRNLFFFHNKYLCKIVLTVTGCHKGKEFDISLCGDHQFPFSINHTTWLLLKTLNWVLQIHTAYTKAKIVDLVIVYLRYVTQSNSLSINILLFMSDIDELFLLP